MRLVSVVVLLLLLYCTINSYMYSELGVPVLVLHTVHMLLCVATLLYEYHS